MSGIKPVPDRLGEFAANPSTAPVVMLNLLKFKRGGGSKEYSKYATEFEKLLNRAGGRFLYLGRAAELLVGDEEWDAVALVEYPSRKVFLEVTQSDEAKAIAAFREAGLERTVLYATDPRR
ncbi:MAG: DUF1330 domain-containing protein [Bryobacteraceae bacterium]